MDMQNLEHDDLSPLPPAAPPNCPGQVWEYDPRDIHRMKQLLCKANYVEKVAYE